MMRHTHDDAESEAGRVEPLMTVPEIEECPELAYGVMQELAQERQLRETAEHQLHEERELRERLEQMADRSGSQVVELTRELHEARTQVEDLTESLNTVAENGARESDRRESAEAQLERCQEALREWLSADDALENWESEARSGSWDTAFREAVEAKANARSLLAQPTEPNTPETT